ncbi:tripartite tricarboxylate transporter substrate binding protein [Acetobacteraceae bacterium H6797]|nr:tripartite tricarboxylate transporter substrate binding protein [Acetobacteraceae bacterium H6797]
MSRRQALAGAAALGLAGTARAEDFPSRPVRIVVAFAAGSEPDILARRLGASMERSLGVPVVIDNRPGANTVIAANHVAQSKPDGYTILLTSSTTFSTLPHLYRKPRIDTTQFAPLSLLMRAQMALYCNVKLPVKTAKELVDWAMAQTQPVPYAANPGAIGNLCGELMMQQTGLKLTDIPFSGTPVAQQLVMRGDVPFTFDGVAAYMELVRDNQIRALAVTGHQAVPGLPGIQTFAEAGYPDMAMPYWYGMFAPAATPKPIIDRLVSAIHDGQKNATSVEQFIRQGAELIGNNPDEFATMISTERDKWGALIKRINLQLD